MPKQSTAPDLDHEQKRRASLKLSIIVGEHTNDYARTVTRLGKALERARSFGIETLPVEISGWLDKNKDVIAKMKAAAPDPAGADSDG